MREAERLKNVLRSARTSTGRHESTAEHTWRLALLALVLADENRNSTCPGSLRCAWSTTSGRLTKATSRPLRSTTPPPRPRRNLRPWSGSRPCCPQKPQHASGRLGGVRSLRHARSPLGQGARQGRDHPPAQSGSQSRRFRLRIQPDLRRGVVPRRCAPAPTARRRDGPARRTLTEYFSEMKSPALFRTDPPVRR